LARKEPGEDVVKDKSSWKSDRVGCEVELVRWGVFGQPVLIFPTAGGDAEEIERFHLVGSVTHLLEAGRIKLYSCDSVAGRALATSEGSPQYRGAMQNRFQEYVAHEVVPAIRADCENEEIEVITAGASIGAFNALAHVVRYPELFSGALCMSGTYDLRRFIKDGDPGPEFYQSSPLHYIDQLEGEHLDKLRTRMVVLASGEGKAEDIGESWRVANALGAKGIPNRVDSWGKSADHDWPLWREMFPKYLDELTS
jgi:esterase/lipase superfamily enzyme